MADLFDLPEMSDPDPVRRAQIQMLKPLPKRFYKDVGITETEDGFAIRLDGASVRTPARNVLVVPSAALADIVADEWRGQTEVIDPALMPVTRLVNSALDGVARDPDVTFNDILAFAGTDLLCYRAAEPERLVERQRAQWDPILAWAAETFGARFILAEGVMHQAQPQQALAAFGQALGAFKAPLPLASLHVMTSLTGSALLPLAFAMGRLSAEEAWALAHLDEDWQIELWGPDEEAAHRRAHRWQDMAAAARAFDALDMR
ncbi:ATPase [Xaviernesmea oryzae]|uniref:ATPase n=1 Tax=Xaviernesmea oryzae TaxID=464029 RepID=A0A1Q9AYN7_9HYPH|nr:ATP12 family protein [Xaviernesmea oryzae]OLP60530.1 ATPase [Xaviernesmea oryzae]SEM29393.1 Chaperone required for the assembly of the F1-ATPase [Xaviernesmea oryzae]